MVRHELHSPSININDVHHNSLYQRELSLAKGGSALNQQALMRNYGVHLEGLDRIYLAGGFGNYVNLDSAIAIGSLPAAREKLVKIGNGALTG